MRIFLGWIRSTKRGALPGVGLNQETLLVRRVVGDERARAVAGQAFIALGRGILFIAFLGAWAFISGRFVDRQFVSNPLEVMTAFSTLVSSGSLWQNLGQTLVEVLAGYGVGASLGIIAALLFAPLETAQQVLRPFLVAIYAIPKIALAPLIIMWFGLETAPKVILAAGFVFFVVFMNMSAGVYSVAPDLLNVARVMSAGRLSLVGKIILPGTVPYLFVGLRLAVPEALLGAVVGEFISSRSGLDYLVNSAVEQFNAAAALAAIVALLLIVLIMDAGLNIAERRLLRWQPRAHSA